MPVQEHERQPFPDLVPVQFVVLYGIKSLAIKNINEILYGVHTERFRKGEERLPSGKARAEGEEMLTEPEPLLMPFWRGTWHRVPFASAPRCATLSSTLTCSRSSPRRGAYASTQVRGRP
jgi:hypothetical protein